MDRQVLQRDHYQRKTFLRLSFKLTSVDGKSTDDPRDFDNAPGLITVVRNANTKAWELIEGTKDSFSKIRMAQVESPELRKLAKTSSRSSFYPPSLYRALNLTQT